MCYFLHDGSSRRGGSLLIRLAPHPITILSLVVLAATGKISVASAAAGTDSATTSAPAAAAFDHSTWDRLLATYVDDEGRVAYRKLQSQDKPLLQSYLDALAGADPSSWPQAEQIAFWLNAYNAAMWSGVLQGQSGESVDARAQFFKAWRFKVAGRLRTPDEVENEILRKFNEPRIHFALVCAATSCPRLQRQAYRGATLNADLDAQAKRFINDPGRNVINPAWPKIQISMLFVWFKEDFMRAAGTIEKYIAPYVENAAAREFLLSGQTPTQHFIYDWMLNAQPEQRPWIEMKGAPKP